MRNKHMTVISKSSTLKQVNKRSVLLLEVASVRRWKSKEKKGETCFYDYDDVVLRVDV